jgi:hypothetical protein
VTAIALDHLVLPLGRPARQASLGSVVRVQRRRDALIDVLHEPAHAELRFAASDGVRDRVEAIVRAEAQCCAFLDVEVRDARPRRGAARRLRWRRDAGIARRRRRREPGRGLLAAGPRIHPALINGAVGAVATRDGRPFSVGAVTVRDGKIVELDFLSHPERLAQLDLTVLDG